MARSTARKRALNTLYEADEKNQDIESLLEERLEYPGAPTPLPDYAVQICRGIAEHRKGVDRMLDRYSTKWKVKRMPVVDRNILRIGAWEILYNEEVPDGVAIDEAIALAKTLSDDGAPAFVHGLLSAVSEHKDDVREFERPQDSADDDSPASGAADADGAANGEDAADRRSAQADNAGNTQAEGAQAEGLQPEKLQAEGAQAEGAQAEDSQPEEPSEAADSRSPLDGDDSRRSPSTLQTAGRVRRHQESDADWSAWDADLSDLGVSFEDSTDSSDSADSDTVSQSSGESEESVPEDSAGADGDTADGADAPREAEGSDAADSADAESDTSDGSDAGGPDADVAAADSPAQQE